LKGSTGGLHTYLVLLSNDLTLLFILLLHISRFVQVGSQLCVHSMGSYCNSTSVILIVDCTVYRIYRTQ